MLADNVVAMHVAIVDLLLALIEGAGSADDGATAIEAIVANVNARGFVEATSLLERERVLLEPATDREVALSSAAFRCIKRVVERDTARTASYVDALEVCEAHTRSRIGRIEVVTDNNALETLYFPIPLDFRKQPRQKRVFFSGGMSQALTNVVAVTRDGDPTIDARHAKAEAKLNRQLDSALIRDDINWNRAGDKIDGFVRWSEKVLLRREQQLENKRDWFSRTMSALWPYFWNATFIVALLICALLLFVDVEEGASTGQARNSFPLNPLFVLIIRSLGGLQVFLSLLVLVTFMIRKSVYLNRKAWLRKYRMAQKAKSGAFGKGDSARDECLVLLPWDEVRRSYLKPLNKSVAGYIFFSVINVVWHPLTIFYIVYLAVAIAGVLNRPYWFAFQLFQIIVRSQHLRVIMKALRMNIISLLLMVWLVVDFQYVFAILAYVFFPNFFSEGVSEAQHCETLMQCFLTMLYYGLPSGGGLYEFTMPYGVDAWDGTIPSQSYAWVTFAVIYFFVMGVVLLNVFSAIIVDTFGQIREARKEAKDNLGITCFICSLERDAFQQRARDFNVHLEQEHNRLHYLYFFAYLRDLMQRGQQQSDLEQSLAEQIRYRKFLKFFPISRARALEADDVDANEVQARLVAKLSKLGQQLDQNETTAAKIVKQAQDGARQVPQLRDELQVLKDDIHELRRLLGGKDTSRKGGLSPSVRKRSPSGGPLTLAVPSTRR